MRPKILFVINTMGRAGAEKSLITLLRAIGTRAEISLLSIVERGEMFEDVPPDVTILNKAPSNKPILGLGGAVWLAKKIAFLLLAKGYIFRFIPFFVRTIFGNSGRFQADKLFWPLLAQTAPRINQNYDLAIAFLEGAATYYVADSVNAKNKIAFVHVNYEKAGYSKTFDEKYYKAMRNICCISPAVRDVFLKIYPEHAEITRVFPNIIFPEDICRAAREGTGFDDDFGGLRILTVGRLHHQKGYDIAIPAFAKLIEQGYDMRWYVLGDGSEKSRLVKLIKKHGLAGKFILLGSRPNPYPFINECDMYVQPSRFEGFPLTLQEALILHKPCITTNFEGADGFLESGKNVVIIELSEENIAAAIKKFADDESFRKQIADATRRISLSFPDESDFLFDII